MPHRSLNLSTNAGGFPALPPPERAKLPNNLTAQSLILTFNVPITLD